jgi:hypothetical protein
MPSSKSGLEVNDLQHQFPEIGDEANSPSPQNGTPLNLTMDMKQPTSRSKTFEDFNPLDVFCLFFGLLRQSIWKVDPRMKRVMLEENN